MNAGAGRAGPTWHSMCVIRLPNRPIVNQSPATPHGGAALTIILLGEGMTLKWFLRLWDEDAGALIAGEWVFVATFLTLGTFSGLIAVRQEINAEFNDCANAKCTSGQDD